MSDFFTFGPTGHGVALDPSGRIMTVTSPPLGSHVFGYGITGRPMLVDDDGRLLITTQSPSGVILPDPSLYGFGDMFYLVGAGSYRRGISNWEFATAVPPSGVGDITTGQSVGNGVPVFSAKAADTLQFHSLGAGSGIKLTLASEKITVDNKVTRALDMSIADAGNYYPTHNVESALQEVGAQSDSVYTDFYNASGVMTDATAQAEADANGVRVDFTNSSGIFQAKVATITSAGGTSIVKAATGVMKGILAGTGVTLTAETNDVKIDVKDFANASGAFVKSAASAGGTSWVKTGSAPAIALKGLTAGTGVKLTSGTNDITVDVKDFANASGAFVKSAASAGGTSIIKTGTAPALSLKGLVAGSGIGIVVGTNTLTIGMHCASGGTLPSFASVPFGQEFYHHVSGFYKKGQYIWELQTNMIPHTSQWWMDTTPAAGASISLPTANTYVRLSSVQASGGLESDHGIRVTTSGIKILDDETAGRYTASWNLSFEGSTNTTFYGALFKNSSRLRASQNTNRITTAADIKVMSSRVIVDLGKNDELTLRFAAGANSKVINIFTMNVSLVRISAKNQVLAP